MLKNKYVKIILIVLVVLITLELGTKIIFSRNDSTEVAKQNKNQETNGATNIEDEIDIEDDSTEVTAAEEEKVSMSSIRLDIEDAINTTDNNYYSDFLTELVTLMDYGIVSYEPFDRTLIKEGVMNNTQIRDFYSILNDLWKINEGLEQTSVLEGKIDCLVLPKNRWIDYEYFVRELKEYPEFTIESSVQIAENVFSINVELSNGVGDLKSEDEEYQYEDKSISLTYNTELEQISFGNVIQRHPVNILYEDERFNIHIFYLESNLEQTDIYMTFSHTYDFDVNITEIPAIVASITGVDEQERNALIVLEGQFNAKTVAKKGETIIVKAGLSSAVKEIKSIVIKNQ